MSLCLVLGGTATVAVYKNTGVAYDETGIGSNYGDVVASMTKCSPDHPVVTQDTYLYTNFWDVFASCPRLLLHLFSRFLPDGGRGGRLWH